MTFADDVENNINILARASGFLKASFILIPIALLFHIIGFSTKYWLDGDGNQGLWTYCGKTSVYKCCSTIKFHVDQTNSEVPAFINATRVFQCFGLIGAVVAVVLIIICIFISSDQGKKVAKISTMIASFATAAVIILGIIIYGARFRYENLTSKYSISYSYVFCTIAGILFIVPGLLIVIEEFAKNNSVTPITNDTSGRPEPSAPPPPPPETTVQPFQAEPNITVPSTSGTGNESNECVVCLDRPKQVAFSPCGHIACCSDCSDILRNARDTCPMCRGPIDGVMRVYQT